MLLLKSAWKLVCRILDAGMQQQQQDPAVQQRKIIAFPARSINDRQAMVVGLLLAIIGCLSILFNSAELAVGTGIKHFWYMSSEYSSTFSLVTISYTSLGVVGHGIWCGVWVSVMYIISLQPAHATIITSAGRYCDSSCPLVGVCVCVR